MPVYPHEMSPRVQISHNPPDLTIIFPPQSSEKKTTNESARVLEVGAQRGCGVRLEAVSWLMCRHECSVGTCLHTWLYVTKVKAGDLWSSWGNYCPGGQTDPASDSKEVSVDHCTKPLCKTLHPLQTHTHTPLASFTPIVSNLMGCRFIMTHPHSLMVLVGRHYRWHTATTDLHPRKHKAVGLYGPTNTSQHESHAAAPCVEYNETTHTGNPLGKM